MNKQKKRLWIDALTPKQALFTKSLVERAPPSFDITVTTRDYSELNQFVSRIKLEQTPIGRHGGGDLLGKLEASVDRQRALVEFVKGSEKFDYSLSYISPEAARVSFGLGISHFISSDSPHAQAACRLAIPLSERLFSPFVIATDRWMRYGIGKTSIQKYHALDPWCWLLSFPREEMDNSEMKNRILIRLEESLASYTKKGKGISDTLEKLVALIKDVGGFEILLVPRYDEQRKWAKEKFGKDCTVPGAPIDGVREILGSDLVIGGGATMTQEAALLGIPNISYFPSSPLDVFEKFYHPKGLSIKAATPDQLLREARKLLRNLREQKEYFNARAKKIVSGFEDPAKFIFEKISE